MPDSLSSIQIRCPSLTNCWPCSLSTLGAGGHNHGRSRTLNAPPTQFQSMFQVFSLMYKTNCKLGHGLRTPGGGGGCLGPWPAPADPLRKKSVPKGSFAKKTACSSYVQQWLVATGGWRLAAIGGWRLVAGGGRRLAVGGPWARSLWPVLHKKKTLGSLRTTLA